MTGVEQARIDAIKGCTTWGEADANLARIEACAVWFTNIAASQLMGTKVAIAYHDGPIADALVMFDSYFIGDRPWVKHDAPPP